MKGSEKRAGRVLVALTSGGGRAAPLDLCLPLLDQAPLELLGLLVEDAAALAHAHSALAREIVLSGLERPLDPVRLDRQLRAQSAAVRRAFERDAARLGLAHAFEVVRGEPVSELRRAAETADALIVDAAVRAAYRLGAWPERMLRALVETPLRRIAFAGAGWSTGTEIVAVAEAAPLSGPPGAALTAALRIAKRTRSPLRVILLAGDETPGPGTAQLAAEVERTARAAGVRLDQMTVLSASRSKAAAAAYARRARLVVLTPKQAADAELVARARGAVLIVRES